MRHPAAFINLISEGRNFAEALKHLQETWDELCETRANLFVLQGEPVGDVVIGPRLPIVSRLTRIQVGGCTCGIKPPDLDMHAEDCHYRLATEAENLLAVPAKRRESNSALVAALDLAIESGRDFHGLPLVQLKAAIA